MRNASEALQAYLSALDGAAHAIELARRIKPDPGLEHALQRLQQLMLEGSQDLAPDSDFFAAD